MIHKRTPGPVGTSCLTCKHRRKKCDRGRPVCERCTTGGFECLGYGHNEKCSPSSSLTDSPRDSSCQEENGTHTPSHKLPPLHFPEDVYPTIETGRAAFSPLIPIPSSLLEQPVTPATSASNTLYATPTPHLDLHITHAHDNNLDPTPRHHSPMFVDSNELLPAWQACPSHQTYSTTHSLASAPDGSVTHPDNSSQLVPLSSYPWQSLQSSGGQCVLSIPRRLPPVSPNTANVIRYVLSQYERLASLSYFRPLHHQVVKMRESVSWRLQTSDTTRWVMYLGAKIFESLLEGILPEKTAAYDNWVQRYERELHSTPYRALTNDEFQNRLCGALEVGFLKLRLHQSFNVIKLLRSCAFTVLQIVFSDPTLWPNEHDFTPVSIAHIFNSERHELGHFVLLDTFCAVAYAVPPSLQYDTSYPILKVDMHPVEWIHGCPMEFQIALIDISSRCTLGDVAPDWQNIEQRIISWQPRPGVPTGEAWKDVARLAVQESWRQVLLAYLYMAVCGVASDDPRVQSAVRQIFQLLGTVRRQDPPVVNVHFFIPYLIAGACTPSEKRRAFVRSRMVDKYENRLWLLSGADFVRVLDHLWHGAAANGRPIRWSDYMASRQTILPVPL